MTLPKNQLANETSPYLLAHVYNPVNWYPWCDIALTKAKTENKPILLSIGYSACHWCHVMAHESFEDPAVAKIMNKFFINIKVDREERPDLDKIYQLSHQILTQRGGGWPLTVFLAPADFTAFFAGTYFPKEPRYGMPGFVEILPKIASFYHQETAAVNHQNDKLREILQQFEYRDLVVSNDLNAAPLASAITEISVRYDKINGGFGAAPKFPQPAYLSRLLQQAQAQQDSQALAMVSHTLIQMAQGGIYDQLGGGFFRYSVDAYWHIPHFEKMLYDNAQLLTLYSAAYAITGEAIFAGVLTTTGNWILAEMQAANGGYYATLNADSEQQEGKFYVWQASEIKALLAVEEYQVIEIYYGLNNPANFEHAWHLLQVKSITEIAAELKFSAEKAESLLSAAKQKVLLARTSRVRPSRDEKIITAWNGLMIQGIALAGMQLQNLAFIDSAQRAVSFIYQHLWQQQRLLAVYKDNQARFIAYVDDYAFLLNSLLTLLQAKWRNSELEFAIELAESLLKHYADINGGLFFTAHDHEAYLPRLKSFADEVTPSGNGVAAIALARLGYLIGEPRYLAAAEKILKAAWSQLQQAPAEHHSLLTALEDYLKPPEIIILRGKEPELTQWKVACQSNYKASRLVFAIPAGQLNLLKSLADKIANHPITAYICRGTQCLAPITQLTQLTAYLNKENHDYSDFN